ncbi:hypothetical protein E2C01_063444 [Portunus trituberculatus]|uniref:Uncharacterized protein n=1 Tax=Portunus trituberculatus TaxID=210409 RepID=A0A5B7HKH4_PORTR|nr:hypothetical protein [Portunus trituberculatus]
MWASRDAASLRATTTSPPAESEAWTFIHRHSETSATCLGYGGRLRYILKRLIAWRITTATLTAFSSSFLTVLQQRIETFLVISERQCVMSPVSVSGLRPLLSASRGETTMGLTSPAAG